MSSLINGPALTAVWRRQLSSLLGNPLGYIFILFFVLVSAGVLFLPKSFFARNITDLGGLLSYNGVPSMAVLLAVLVPALAMGSWASERESGTEELLLTMPLSLLDAVLGKYLAVVSYLTIALLCSLSNVGVLAYLGDPDAGLVFANYVGWWFAVLVFAAWSLVASVLVAMPAIAFVLGALFCGVLLCLGWRFDFFDASSRGLISIAQIITALSLAGLGISIALMLLASRRWRAGAEEKIVYQILSLVFALILAVNIARIAGQRGIDVDVSGDGISSLAPESAAILKDLKRQVTISTFISADTPDHLLVKRKEIEDRVKAIARLGGQMVTLKLYYPKDSLDEKALLASQNFNLKPRKEVVERVTGREPEDIFLGAAVTSGGRTQVIDYFDPGLSVEYELVRAVRAVSAEKKRVLGLATTDLEMSAGFDFRAQQMRPAWQITEEWKKLYDVREVNLDAPVASDVEALVVPQPSGLSDAQLKNLHDYIWGGGPTLIMEDPFPVWSGPNLAASQPKKSANPYGQPDESGPKKGDLAPLLKSLGISFNLDAVVWSDFSPSNTLRGQIPRNFVFIRREGDQGESPSFGASPITKGFESILFPFPGRIEVAAHKAKDLTVLPLIRPSATANWGWHNFGELVEQGFGPLQPKEPKRWLPSSGELPAVAVEITGTMPSAYPKADPGAKPSEAKPGEMTPAAEERTGVPSPKKIHVVVIADTDFAHDAVYNIYRNIGGRYKGDDLGFLKDLRNVQFAMNAVDALLGENQLVGIRNKLPPPRSLKLLDDVQTAAQKQKGIAENEARDEAERELAGKKAELEDAVAKIDQDQSLDEVTKANLKEAKRKVLERRLEVDSNAIAQKAEIAVQRARSVQRSEIESRHVRIRILALMTPFLILSSLALMIFIRKGIRERTNVPVARARSNA